MLNKDDTVMMTSFSPAEVKVISNTKAKAMVNLLQNNYYGWKATIDGQPAEVITGNLSFISVLVPAGEHEVIFIYNPKIVRIGFWISLGAIVLGIGFLMFNVIHFSSGRVLQSDG
jgi:uncharacterized membrane protein YfhO